MFRGTGWRYGAYLAEEAGPPTPPGVGAFQGETAAPMARGITASSASDGALVHFAFTSSTEAMRFLQFEGQFGSGREAVA